MTEQPAPHRLTIELHPALWREFKSIAHSQGVSYASLAVACIQRQVFPDGGLPLMDVFAEGRESSAPVPEK